MRIFYFFFLLITTGLSLHSGDGMQEASNPVRSVRCRAILIIADVSHVLFFFFFKLAAT